MPKFRNCSDAARRAAALLALLPLAALPAAGQRFGLLASGDSLNVLTLATDSTADRLEIPHAVYRFATGDLTGDGQEEALVGVEKATRFYPTMERRLHIYKNVKGHIRPLWMGSRLGGRLHDFRCRNGRVLSVESGADGSFRVGEYRLGTFGLTFCRYLIENTTEEEAWRALHAAR